MKKIKGKHAKGCFETVNCKGVILVKEEEITALMLTTDRETDKM